MDSLDSDLKFFIDIDMSVLGWNRIEYLEYAKQIRNEYIHINHLEYCHGKWYVYIFALNICNNHI